jgi:hypothetical protein
MVAANQRVEALGPAERIIQSLIQYSDHMVHNRPGLVVPDARQRIGVRWDQATWVKENEQKVVYRVTKIGKRQQKTRVGTMNGTYEVKDGNRVVGQFRNPGLFPEVTAYLYNQVAEVWKLDNEFAAHWASWAYENEENRDLKVLLASFMLVQSRFGEPIKDGDETFADADYRAVGEAMCLLHSKKKGGSFNPKLLLRIGEVLETPGVIEANRKLGFGQSARSTITGRYYKVIEKYLHHLETNTKILEKMIKEGFRGGIMALARKVGYKPSAEKFFELLRWKQVQSKAGHRTVAVGKKVRKADTWEGLTEEQICKKIIKTKPGYKLIAGKLPSTIGLTPAIMAAAIEAGSVTDNDLIILTPTLEELGLLKNAEIQARWKAATEKAENQRAANIARNVKTKEVKEVLQDAADMAAKKVVEEAVKDFRIYLIVDRSGSMEGAIERAKELAAKLVVSFPLDRVHICLFNTEARELKIERASLVGINQAFRGITAGGGTSYATGAGYIIRQHPPKPEEDAILFFVGDEEDNGLDELVSAIETSGAHPVAFGLLHIGHMAGHAYYGFGGRHDLISQAAARLKIPCFNIEEQIFNDPYAVPRTLRNIIKATPVGKATGPAPVKRVTLIETILNTPLLQKPVWA